MSETVDRLWTSCDMSEEGVRCRGKGSVEIGESFNISANGLLIEVVVEGWETPGPIWTAIDRPQWDRRYRVDDDGQSGSQEARRG